MASLEIVRKKEKGFCVAETNKQTQNTAKIPKLYSAELFF